MSSTKNYSDVSGMLGESATLRKVRGQVVVKNRPKRRLSRPKPFPRDPSRQDATRARFREASQYACLQISLAESKAMYARRITARKRSAYLVALSDYMVAPKVYVIDTVDYQGTVGDTITVKATDDFMVTKVRIVIANAAGIRLEEGEAGPNLQRINLWEYKAKTANPNLAGTIIQALAYDRPGNIGRAEIVL